MTIQMLIEEAIAEDSSLGDFTSEAIIPAGDRGVAELLSKGEGIVAGLEIAGLVFRTCDDSAGFRPMVNDGARAARMQRLAIVEAPVRAILRGERVALNFLQRMSGIATITGRYVDAVRGTQARITDTRKTAPGLRLLDKMAVKAGGGVNHRFGLDDMVLIKDNHIVAAGGIRPAVEACLRALSSANRSMAVEVETRNLDEVREALLCVGVQRIMLDNFPLELMREAVRLINHRVEVEASGGITLNSVRSVAETGVDCISVGALTHSVEALDISLELLVV